MKMKVPEVTTGKFPTDLEVGGGRGYQPTIRKGAGPQILKPGARFGKGLDASGRSFNPPSPTSGGPQVHQPGMRFGKGLDSVGRSFNPPSPKSGAPK